jgi:endonuclease YncB( thermonuclease family)
MVMHRLGRPSPPHRWRGAILVALLVALAGCLPADDRAPDHAGAPAAADRWTVVRVIDGDTVDVQRGATRERVRVIGIDTPERGECGFESASDALADLVLHRDITLTPGARDDRDRYDRLLRYLDLGDTDAGLSLIRQGLAIARYDSRDGHGRHPREDAYVAADAASEHVCGVTFESVTGR